MLDVGAGIGTFTELAAPGREVVAVEPEDELLPILRDRFDGNPSVAVIEGTVEEVTGTFDSVMCLNVLEHIHDDRGTLARFHDLLAPGGGLLLLVPAHPLLYGSIDRTVEHAPLPKEIQRLLVETGFEIDDLRLVNPLGAAGWLVSSRILRREHVSVGPLRFYDRLVPVLRVLDRVQFPVGLSVWAVARRGPSEHAEEEQAEGRLDAERDQRHAEESEPWVGKAVEQRVHGDARADHEERSGGRKAVLEP